MSMNKLTRYFRGVGEEARRIRWPDKKTLWFSVGIVLVIAIISALVTYGSDWIAMQINRAFGIAFPSSSSATDSSTDSSSAEAVANIINNTINGGLL